VNTVAPKFAKKYGKRALLLAVAVLAAMIAAKTGHHAGSIGFFDGG
jgi:hypothetical protein